MGTLVKILVVCDLYKSEIKLIENQIATCVDNETKNSLNKALKKKSIEHELRKRKGDKFYELKRKYRRKAKKTPNLEVMVMDYQRNLPTPNVTTNDVCYRRQLNFIFFNVHVTNLQYSTLMMKLLNEKEQMTYVQCLNIIFSKFWIRKSKN